MKDMRPNSIKKKKMKYKKLNTKNWGIDFNKNEYKEIILSNSNHPETIYVAPYPSVG